MDLKLSKLQNTKVLFKNTLSCLLYVTSSVPKGSLSSVVTHSRVLMYADGVK